jgi:glycerophosphoryl diester phosphodiesterase
MDVLVVAHRAGNSLSGLAAAPLLGADAVELDVHSYRGRLEVRHLKTAGPLPFLWDRWELRAASEPRLELGDVLEATPPGVTLMLDLKGPRTSIGTATGRLLREQGWDRPLLACGRRWSAVDALAAELEQVRPVLSVRNRLELGLLLRRLDTAPAPYGVSMHGSLLSTPLIARLHRDVERVLTWPVNDLQALDRVLTHGVTGVISDEPATLREALAQL